MAGINQTHRFVATFGGISYTAGDVVHSSGNSNNLSEAIPNSSTDLLVSWAAKYTKIKALYILVDGPCVIETNSGSAADNTLTFTSTKLWYYWDQYSLSPCLLTADVTALYLTQSSGSTINLIIGCIIDPT